jgi:hypothetical protein
VTPLLELYSTSESTTAWRTTERDAPGLFAIITDESGLAVPAAPDTDNMIIAIFDEARPETIGSFEIDGREGLNRWYLQNVGYEPDKEGDGPLAIMELINNVAGHLMLRYYEGDAVADIMANKPC